MAIGCWEEAMKTLRARVTVLEKAVASLTAVKPPSYEAYQVMYQQERLMRMELERALLALGEELKRLRDEMKARAHRGVAIAWEAKE
jgi:hypothetical protein